MTSLIPTNKFVANWNVVANWNGCVTHPTNQFLAMRMRDARVPHLPLKILFYSTLKIIFVVSI